VALAVFAARVFRPQTSERREGWTWVVSVLAERLSGAGWHPARRLAIGALFRTCETTCSARLKMMVSAISKSSKSGGGHDAGAMASLAFEEARLRVGTLSIGALLAAAGGFLDGFTYVGHGHVFANAMTGNVVLLGINCLAGSWRTALHLLPAILAFLVGVCVSQTMQLYSRHRGVSAPYAAVLVLEISVLLVLSLLPATAADILFTTTIAFAASVQVQTFREVNGHNFNSTFTTGNLRTLSEAAFAWFFEGRRPEAVQVVRDFSVICAAFLVGATAGGYAAQAFGNRALWCDIVLLVLVAISVQARLRLPLIALEQEVQMSQAAPEESPVFRWWKG
jgi:uncharacterized membrane protein YoaK (UPF0700 family)